MDHFLAYILPSSTATTTTPTNMFLKHAVSILTAPNIRIYLIVCLFLLRLALYKYYAQGYLNLAYEVALNMRRRGAARITNLKYMSTVSSIYQYYGVVASQYVIPVYVLLFWALLLKTLGNMSWCVTGHLGADIFYCEQTVETIGNYTGALLRVSTSPTLSSGVLKRLEEASSLNVTMGHNALNRIFTPYVLRSIVGYFAFWTSTVWFGISCFGLLYYQYIDKVLVVNSD